MEENENHNDKITEIIVSDSFLMFIGFNLNSSIGTL